MVLKLDLKRSVVSDGSSPTKLVFKKSWSVGSALETFVFFALAMGLIALALLTANDGGPVTSQVVRNSIILIGVALALVGSMLVYSDSQQQNFISAVCRQYGYTLEDLNNSILDENPDKIESRMLLPMSPIAPTNFDIYVIRNNKGTFVEEVHT